MSQFLQYFSSTFKLRQEPQCLKITQKFKMSHLQFFNFGISTNLCPIKSDLSGNTFDCKLQVFKNSSKLSIFGIFNQLKM